MTTRPDCRTSSKSASFISSGSSSSAHETSTETQSSSSTSVRSDGWSSFATSSRSGDSLVSPSTTNGSDTTQASVSQTKVPSPGHPDEEFATRYDFDRLSGSQRNLQLQLDDLRKNILERLTNSLFQKLEETRKENQVMKEELAQLKKKQNELVGQSQLHAENTVKAKPGSVQSAPANITQKDAPSETPPNILELAPASASDISLITSLLANCPKDSSLKYPIVDPTGPRRQFGSGQSGSWPSAGPSTVPPTRQHTTHLVEHPENLNRAELRRQIDMRMMQPVPSQETLTFLKDLVAYYTALTDRHPPSTGYNAAGRQAATAATRQPPAAPTAANHQALGRARIVKSETIDAKLNGETVRTPEVVKPREVAPALFKKPGVKRKAGSADLGDFCCLCHPRSSGTCIRCHGPNGFCTNCRNKKCRFKQFPPVKAEASSAKVQSAVGTSAPHNKEVVTTPPSRPGLSLRIPYKPVCFARELAPEKPTSSAEEEDSSTTQSEDNASPGRHPQTVNHDQLRQLMHE